MLSHEPNWKFIFAAVVLVGVMALLTPFSAQGEIFSPQGNDPQPTPQPAESTPNYRPSLSESPDAAESLGLITPSIVGGSVVEPENKYPWMVSQRINGDQFCAGILVGGDGSTSEWVLTSANCWVDGEGMLYDISSEEIVLGEYDLVSDWGYEQVITPAAIYIHPEYVHLSKQYDLALVQLSTPAVFTDFVQPISLTPYNHMENTLAIIAGWGATFPEGEYPDVLYEAAVDILPDSACDSYNELFDPDSMLCAASSDFSQDTCSGDSGGPLFFQDESGNWVLAGVTSFGLGCAQSNYPGVYADVSAALEWIQNYVTYDCSQVTTIPQSECEALVSLYSSTQGEQWVDNTNWLQNNDPCTWAGLTCENEHITEVDLYGYGLIGVLPFNMENLTLLEILAIGKSDLTGPFPSWILGMSQLREIALDWNNFYGTLPTGLSNLSQLNFFDVSYNQFSGTLPTDIGNLEWLRFLAVNDNLFTGSIPSEFANLHLSGFIYNNTDLCELQGGYFQDWLSWMDSTGTGVPCDICSMQTDVPELECRALEALYNSTDGQNWELLEDNNWLLSEKICEEWLGIECEEGHIAAIDLYHGGGLGLTGTLPPELGDLDNLVALYLSKNNLSGSLPEELWDLERLVYLDLSDNLLEGQLSVEIANSNSLMELVLSGNAFSGTIPDEIFQSTINFLYLSGNQITGGLPQHLESINLRTLYLDDNPIGGTIPATTDFPNLYRLSLNNTGLEGTIPATTNFPNLRYLSINNTGLEGTIPDTIVQSKKLYYLSLADNNLTGDISVLAPLWGLTFLDLSGNQLTGTIPESIIGNNTRLTTLDLSFNQFFGNLPEKIAYYSKLTNIYIDHNNLSGHIPLAYTELDLDLFYFDETQLCEMPQESFQNWLAGISDLRSTGNVCTAPDPVVTFLSPKAGGVLTQPRANIFIDAEENGSTVTGVDFYAYYSDAWHLLGTDENGDDGWLYKWTTQDIPADMVDIKVVVTDNVLNEVTAQLDDIRVSAVKSVGDEENGFTTRGGGEDEEESPAETPEEAPAPVVQAPVVVLPPAPAEAVHFPPRADILDGGRQYLQ